MDLLTPLMGYPMVVFDQLLGKAEGGNLSSILGKEVARIRKQKGNTRETA
jgi:hypothetical protein